MREIDQIRFKAWQTVCILRLDFVERITEFLFDLTVYDFLKIFLG